MKQKEHKEIAMIINGCRVLDINTSTMDVISHRFTDYFEKKHSKDEILLEHSVIASFYMEELINCKDEDVAVRKLITFCSDKEFTRKDREEFLKDCGER